MTEYHPRIARERKTVDLMIALYCRDLHHTDGKLCAECQSLQDYARLRLEKCPYQETKSTCANCLTHCYQRSKRDAIREVMRYAGPRLLRQHPWLAIMHLLEGLRKPSGLKKTVKKESD